MALWGISTTTETYDNNFALPKHLRDTDRRNTPWNCFADERGWIYRRYHTSEQSGLSTDYHDEILIDVTNLNGQSTGANETGLSQAGPVAVFFEDPNRSSRISLGVGNGTSGIATNTTGYIHVVFNELVFASAGATMNIRAFDANGANETTSVVAYATSYVSGATVYNWVGAAANNYAPVGATNYNGQITNRVAFAFTSPSIPLSANVLFLTTAVSAGNTAGVGATTIYIDSTSGVSVGSSVTVNTNAGIKITNAPVVSVASTYIQIGAGSTSNAALGVGSTVTFSTLTRATVLKLDADRGFVGVITDAYNGVGVISSFTAQFAADLVRNVGGAGTAFSGVGIGTTTLTVS
jgi:hypothetical protein